MCHRTLGIGADGIEWIVPGEPGVADAAITLINADGSDAEISGNGTRCVAAHLAKETHKQSIRLMTGAGLKTCSLLSVAGSTYRFSTEMGKIHHVEKRRVMGIEGVFVDIGNPHFVVVGSLPQDWRRIAKSLQRESSEFPHGVNIEFVSVESSERVRALFYERGAGETSSSGTGSCASAIACKHLGFAGASVEVIAPGGAQVVSLDGSTISLEGTATLICRGEAWL